MAREVGQPMLASQIAAARRAYSKGLQCPEEAFSTEELTIVEATNPPWPYLAIIATFGTGTVLSIDPEYRALAEANRPVLHFVATRPVFTRVLVDEAARRGRTVRHQGPNLCFVLGSPPPLLDVPPGLTLREVDAAWMAAQQSSGFFENGVGEPGLEAREFRNQYGMALFDERDVPVAVGGVFLTYGMHEIGVDVVRARRGEGLGRIVVAEAARAALQRGATPMYGCSVTNIRSQRTALTCGFVPAWSDASVS